MSAVYRRNYHQWVQRRRPLAPTNDQAVTVGGTLTSAGATSKSTSKTAAGTLTTAGAATVLRVLLMTLTSTLNFAGAVARAAQRAATGALTSAGAVAKASTRAFGGTLSPSSWLDGVNDGFTRTLGGVVGFAGTVRKLVLYGRGGNLEPRGTTTVPSLTWRFTPPVRRYGARNLPEAERRRAGVSRSANRRAFRFRGVSEAPTVVRISGVYQEIIGPSNAALDSATEVYLAGHVYVVDSPTAHRLIDAGYTLEALP